MTVEYVKMSFEEAKKHNIQTVLVAVRDLENPDEITRFTKKNKEECEKILREAETIVGVFDDFVNQLRAFTVKQPDIYNIKPIGKQSTILIKENF